MRKRASVLVTTIFMILIENERICFIYYKLFDLSCLKSWKSWLIKQLDVKICDSDFSIKCVGLRTACLWFIRVYTKEYAA